MFRLFQQGCDVCLNELPRGACLTNFSMLNDVSERVVFRSFSIKYVLEGREQYTVNGTRYDVTGGSYLLANASCDGRVNIDSPQLVKGLCIDVAPELLSEAFAHLLRPGAAFPDIVLDDFFTRESFLENCYNGRDTQLGRELQALGQQLSQNPRSGYALDESFYYRLATAIVADHEPVIAKLYRIDTVKHATRKELYRKVCRGKEFIEANWDGQFRIADAASHATLSAYHFSRLFKSAFGRSPQQYLIHYRLEQAKHLLRSDNYSVTEAALAAGFGDAAGFSKAFRRKFGIPPSMTQNMNADSHDSHD